MSKVLDYVAEEVQRQGHNTNRSEGVWRVVWMLEAWRQAQMCSTTLDLNFVIGLGRLIEPSKNHHTLRNCMVFVGDKQPPPPDKVFGLLIEWWQNLHEHTPLENYRAFEDIHPFVDGNGRAGKIILNWLNNTLDDPIFPPYDFWGRPIANP
jgi:hypothetical protein